MVVPDKDFYAVLGIDRGASALEIKKAYRKLAAQFHPDKYTDSTAEERRLKVLAGERFREINEAHATLADPDKRRDYDFFSSRKSTTATATAVTATRASRQPPSKNNSNAPPQTNPALTPQSSSTAVDSAGLSVGQVAKDGTVYAGTSPITRQPMYVAPQTISATFNEAARYAAELTLDGKHYFHVANRAELKEIFSNMHKGALAPLAHHQYWTSELCYANDGYIMKAKGETYYERISTGLALPAILVRNEPTSSKPPAKKRGFGR